MTSAHSPSLSQLSSSTETSVGVVTHQGTPYSSDIPDDLYLAAISRLLTQAVGFISSLTLFGLPSAYSTRAAIYASTPAERIMFVALLIGEWKIIVLCATFLLSISAVVGLPHAIDHIVVMTLGSISLACGMFTVAFSSLLIAAFNALHARLDDRSNDVSADAERQQVIDGLPSALFDPAQNQAIFWNYSVLIAQPATWMAWFSISSISFLLLSVWKASDTVTTPPTDISRTPIETFVPAIAFTLIFAIGLIYLVLAVRMLRSL